MVVHGPPGALAAQLLDRLQVARLEGVTLLQVLLADGEDDKAARSQRIQHVVEAARWQKICAQSACACHDIEAASVGRWQALLAHDVGDNVRVVALAQEELLLGLGALLTKDIGEAILGQKLSKLTAAGPEV